MLARAVYGAWALAAAGADRRFRRALRDPRSAQHGVLAAILRANSASERGRRGEWAAVAAQLARAPDRALDLFRRQVPLSRYADYGPALAALGEGREGVLTSEKVLRLLPTSGSGGALKLLPYTASFGRALQAAIGPWIVDVLRQYPAIAAGPAYWSISPIFDLPATHGHLPVGFDQDAAYLGPFFEGLVAKVLLAPDGLRAASSLEAFRYATALLWLAEANLRLVSIWHPSFWALVRETWVEYWPQLLEDVAAGRCTPPSPLGEVAARAVAARLRPRPQRAAQLRVGGREAPATVLWPRLSLVSAWADGAAQAPAARLARDLAPCPFQAKGLFATEAFVSLPYQGRHPLALTSHFFEFLAEDGSCREAHQLEQGQVYEVVLTTQAGLYRYQLGDRVEVDGFLGATPSLRFVGRADQVVDQVGEKLEDAFVAAALDEAFAGEPLVFALLAPDPAPGVDPVAGYTLYLDSSLTNPWPGVERFVVALRRNPHFAYASALGQLGPLRVFRVVGDAHSTYLRHLAHRGGLLGGIKPRALARQGGWSEVFEGSYLEGPAVSPRDDDLR